LVISGSSRWFGLIYLSSGLIGGGPTQLNLRQQLVILTSGARTGCV
jgi:hypothetical protein